MEKNIGKHSKEIQIIQLKTNELFAIKNFKLDSLFPNRKIDLIIIDRVPITDSLKEKLKLT